MLEKLYVVSKRKLVIKEIFITSNTFIKAQQIFNTVFFDRKSAEKRLCELIEERTNNEQRVQRSV